MKKGLFLVLIFICLLITGCGSDNSKSGKIKKYELKTYEYYSFLSSEPKKFYINSIEELNKFYSIFSNALEINKDDLKNNTLFIQVMQESSGSVSLELEDVILSNKHVSFVVSTKEPTGITNNMACWYLVAVIPNQKLKNISFNGWIKPTDYKYNY